MRAYGFLGRELGPGAVAIQYTYTSNNEIHRQFDKINSVADNIKATSENLAATNTLLKENLDKIQDTLDSFDISQKQIVSQIKDFTTNRDINITDIPQNNRKQVDK